jgi:hypothetical protein
LGAPLNKATAIGSAVAGASVAALAFAWYAGFGQSDFATRGSIVPDSAPVSKTALFVPVKQYQPIGTAPRDPANLVRALQNELTRVGCYGGPVNGVWSNPTRAAMSTFTERANARLPVDRPDDALLSLVKGSKPGLCAETVAAVAAAPSSPEAMPATREGLLPAQPIPSAPVDAQVQPVARDLKPMPGWVAMPSGEKSVAPAAVQTSTGGTELVSFGSGSNVAAANRPSDQDDLQDNTHDGAARKLPIVNERTDQQPSSVPPVAVKSLDDKPDAGKPEVVKSAKSAKRPPLRAMTAARPSSKPKQPKFVKSLMRSVKNTLASFGIN